MYEDNNPPNWRIAIDLNLRVPDQHLILRTMREVVEALKELRGTSVTLHDATSSTPGLVVPEEYASFVMGAALDRLNGDDYFYHAGCAGPFEDDTYDCETCLYRAHEAVRICRALGLDDDAHEYAQLVAKWRGDRGSES